MFQDQTELSEQAGVGFVQHIDTKCPLQIAPMVRSLHYQATLSHGEMKSTGSEINVRYKAFKYAQTQLRKASTVLALSSASGILGRCSWYLSGYTLGAALLGSQERLAPKAA